MRSYQNQIFYIAVIPLSYVRFEEIPWSGNGEYAATVAEQPSRRREHDTARRATRQLLIVVVKNAY
jgi:hypothetical protein